MPLAELRFVSPTTLADALGELAEPDAVAVGGGTSMALLVREGLVEPSRLVSLGRIRELFGIARVDGLLELGAMTTLRELASSSEVQRHAPALAAAAGEVGNPRVRAVATLGGAVCHGDPRQDVPPALLAAGAKIRIVGPSGAREVEIADFYTGFLETLLAEDEIVTGVAVPITQRSHYIRFTPNGADDWPTIGVAVSLSTDPTGTVRTATVALGGADLTAVLVPAAAVALIGTRAEDTDVRAAAHAAAAECHPTSDLRGSAEYKRAMVEVVVRRTITAALGR